MKIIPNYHPPADYRRPTKTQEKVYVPVNDYPEINFSTITNPVLTHTFFIYSLCIVYAAFLQGRCVSLPLTPKSLSYLPHCYA